MSSVEFDGKVALVTGAGSGTGAATALLLAERGAAVTVVGRRQSKTDEVAAQITSKGGRALAIAGDVSIAHTLESAVRATVDAFGALHFGVNNAGATGIFAPTAEMTEKDWRRVVGTNLDGLFFGMKYEIPAILAAGGGAIVNVSSVFADRGDRRSTTRPPSMRSAGLPVPQQKKYGALGVRVDGLQPGVIDTEMTQANPEGTQAVAETGIPMRRVGQAREIATTIAFLPSDDASYIIGAHLAVDGGFLA
ncbi:SDR family NAD(P)-dependent oxidoreductase [Rhodococcus sp. NPDC059968]|uniref:SDR family NAD(P)-dependent oxidoreductase n=1 Tax=Rhodococcus sp. NPDC059968 TaxID=3347017 RepID=UPI00366CAE15